MEVIDSQKSRSTGPKMKTGNPRDTKIIKAKSRLHLNLVKPLLEIHSKVRSKLTQKTKKRSLKTKSRLRWWTFTDLSSLKTRMMTKMTTLMRKLNNHKINLSIIKSRVSKRLVGLMEQWWKSILIRRDTRLSVTYFLLFSWTLPTKILKNSKPICQKQSTTYWNTVNLLTWSQGFGVKKTLLRQFLGLHKLFLSMIAQDSRESSTIHLLSLW